MTLGELKKSLNRFGIDMDDTEIVLATKISNGKDDFDYLAYIAYTELGKEKDVIAIILGSMTSALAKIKNGSLKTEMGYPVKDEGIDLSGDSAK